MRRHSPEVLALHAEAESFYRQAAREQHAGELDRAAVTREFARGALRRYVKAHLPGVARSLLTPAARARGDAALEAKVLEGDGKAWIRALQEEAPQEEPAT